MKRWHHALRDAESWLASLASGKAKFRVARLINNLYESSLGEPIYILGREDIGSILNITTETASRIIAEMRRDGILTAQPDGYYQVNNRLLQKLLQSEVADE